MHHQLLVDQGVDDVAGATYLTTDEYVWLDGRPVVLVRGRTTTEGARNSDDATRCRRVGEDDAACGAYFPITDHLSRTVMMLNKAGAIAGLADYEPFGYPNRVRHVSGTPHPYAHNQSLSLGRFEQSVETGMSVRFRFLFTAIDTEEPSRGTYADYGRFIDLNTGGEVLRVGGKKYGYWTEWISPAVGNIALEFTSDGKNCCPGGVCDGSLCPEYPDYPYQGLSLEAYEIQRFQSSSVPFWTRLRFPGQYHDPETDLFENWNRYYDPSIGRYLQPEPVLQSPERVLLTASLGASLPSYAYALNNAVNRVDRDGNYSWIVKCDHPIGPNYDTIQVHAHYNNGESDPTGCMDCQVADTARANACNRPMLSPEACACWTKAKDEICGHFNQKTTCTVPPNPNPKPRFEPPPRRACR